MTISLSPLMKMSSKMAEQDDQATEMNSKFSKYELDFVLLKKFFTKADASAISAFNKMMKEVPQERRALFGIGEH